MKKILVMMLTVILLLNLCACGRKACSHNYILADYSAPTATTNGYNKYQCRDCGDSYQEVIPATGNGSTGGNTTVKDEDGGYSKNSRTVRLFDLPLYSSNNCSADYENDIFDIKGYKHQDCYTIYANTVESGSWRPYVRYDLGGNYTRLEGTIYFMQPINKYGRFYEFAWIEFYDGEEFLFSTKKVSEDNYSVEFEFDISGVQYLTLYPRCNSDSGDIIVDQITISK